MACAGMVSPVVGVGSCWGSDLRLILAGCPILFRCVSAAVRVGLSGGWVWVMGRRAFRWGLLSAAVGWIGWAGMGLVIGSSCCGFDARETSGAPCPATLP